MPAPIYIEASILQERRYMLLDDVLREMAENLTTFWDLYQQNPIALENSPEMTAVLQSLTECDRKRYFLDKIIWKAHELGQPSRPLLRAFWGEGAPNEFLSWSTGQWWGANDTQDEDRQSDEGEATKVDQSSNEANVPGAEGETAEPAPVALLDEDWMIKEDDEPNKEDKDKKKKNKRKKRSKKTGKDVPAEAAGGLETAEKKSSVPNDRGASGSKPVEDQAQAAEEEEDEGGWETVPATKQWGKKGKGLAICPR